MKYKVFLKYQVKVSGRIHARIKDNQFRLDVPSEIGRIAVDVHTKENTLTIVHPFEVSDSLLEFLKIEKGEYKASKHAEEELKACFAPLSSAARKVLNCLKYYCNWEDMRDGLSAGTNGWSLDGENWKVYPSTVSFSLGIEHPYTIQPEEVPWLQNYLDDGNDVFLALNYLHRAWNESDPRHRWINATIALELAIKEFLIRLKPEMTTFLLDVPSPPLDKMYGRVLESFIGEKSPKLSQIRDGAPMRNALIHKPHSIEPTREEAAEYVNDAEIAIYHLLSKLYPNDELIKWSVREAAGRSSSFEHVVTPLQWPDQGDEIP